MKLYIDDGLYVDADKNTFILKRERIVMSGKTKGTVRADSIGHFVTLPDLLKYLLNQDVKIETTFLNLVNIYTELDERIDQRLSRILNYLPKHIAELELKVEMLEREIEEWKEKPEGPLT